jgi:hypothetical protein
VSQPREQFDGLAAPGPCREQDVIRDLGGGLVLRRASERDVEALADFNAAVHADPPRWERDTRVEHWTRELMDGRHPWTRARDFMLVHDTAQDRVASSLCLHDLTLHYGEVSFPAGQPELVGTHPGYRNRGLVAAQMEGVHAWSEARGQLVQLIDGIPWYYRQFGYEMALEAKAHRLISRADLPTEAPSGGVRVRDADAGDAPLVAELHARAARRHRLSCRRDAAGWRFEVGRDAGGARRRAILIAEDESGRPLGVAAHVGVLWPPGTLHALLLERVSDGSWSLLLPALLWHLRGVAAGLEGGSRFEFASVGLELGSEHEAYDALGPVARVPHEPAYAFYVRVPDVPAFLRTVAPTLEAHLAASPFAGHTGELALSFYTGGVRIRLEGGRVAVVEEWRPSTEDRGDVAFPGLTFLQLLFGYRSLAELRASFPDCVAWERERQPLVAALFPKQVSSLWTTL